MRDRCGRELDGEGGRTDQNVPLSTLAPGQYILEIRATDIVTQDEAFDSELFAVLMKLIGTFFGFPDFVILFQDAIADRGAGFVRGGVRLEIVELDEDAHFLGAGKRVAEAGADFARANDEGARPIWWGGTEAIRSARIRELASRFSPL